MDEPKFTLLLVASTDPSITTEVRCSMTHEEMLEKLGGTRVDNLHLTELVALKLFLEAWTAGSCACYVCMANDAAELGMSETMLKKAIEGLYRKGYLLIQRVDRALN